MSYLPTIPGYQFEKQLGEGGMGAVYRAVDPAGRRVAMKVLKESGEPDSLDRVRFLREYNVNRDLSHPSLVPVFDYGEEQGVLYYTMECVQGKNLKAHMEDRRFQLPPDAWLKELGELFSYLFSALDYVHTRGVLHRDLKPLNIMVDENRVPRILDFGLARLVGQATQTQSGIIVGTPQYMSPEQIRGEVLDARTDLYSMGVILYELLAQRLPFHGADLMAVMYEILSKPPAPLSEFCPNLPPQVSRVVSRLLHKRREDRYGAAWEIIQELEAFLPPVDAPSGSQAQGVRAQGLYQAYFVGRDAELARVGAVAGVSTAVVVEGGSGVGRTRFLQEAARLFKSDGLRTFFCTCAELSGQPYAAVLPALREAVEAGLPDELQGQTGILAVLMPELASGPLPRGSDDPLLKLRLFDTMETVLAHRPSVLLVDDLHFVDNGSLEFLIFLRRSTRRKNLLMVTSHNTEASLSGTLESALRGWARAGAPVIRLETLSRPDFEKMAQSILGSGMVEDDVFERLWQDTGGNPLFLDELLKTLAEQHKVRLEGGRWRIDPVASGLRSGLMGAAGRRLDGLSEAAMDVAEILSLLGRTPLRVLTLACRLRPEALVEPLEELRMRRVVREVRPGELDFECRMLADAVRDSLSPARAVLAHERLAEVLEGQNASPERIAFHYESAKLYPKAARHLARAGQAQAEAYAYLRACYFYQRALVHDPSLRAELEGAMADAFYGAGEIVRAQSIYEEMVQRQRTAPLLVKLASCHHDTGRLQEAHRMFLEALALHGITLPSQSWLARGLAASKVLHQRLSGKRKRAAVPAHAGELHVLFRRLQRLLFFLRPKDWELDLLDLYVRDSELSDQPPVGQSELFWGIIDLAWGLPGWQKKTQLKARAHLNKARDEILDAPANTRKGGTLSDLGYFMLLSGDLQGKEILRLAVETSRREGSLHNLVTAYSALSLWDGRFGWFDQAELHAQELEALVGYTASKSDRSLLYLVRASNAAFQGNAPEARRHLKSAHDQLPDLKGGLLELLHGIAEAWTLLAEGNFAQAEAVAKTMLSAPWTNQPVNHFHKLQIQVLQLSAQVAQVTEAAAARKLLAALQACAEVCHDLYRGWEATCLRLQGQVLEKLARPEEARQAYAAAYDLAIHCDYPLEEAQALVAQAALDPSASRALLERALSRLLEGAREGPHLDRLQALLREAVA